MYTWLLSKPMHRQFPRALVAFLVVTIFLSLMSMGAAQKRELVYGSVNSLPGIDPHARFNLHAIIALRNVWEPLVDLDAEGFQPRLATDWSISEDNLTWTFKLRQGVTFADGQPFTAEAVKFTFDRIANDAELGYHFIFADVEDTVVVDDHTVQVRLRAPNASFLFNLITVYIIPPDSGEPFTGRVGTGPFTLVDWERGRHLILEANPGYWQEGFPRVDRLVIRPIPEETTRVSALRAGEIHIADGLSGDSVQLLQATREITTLSEPIWQVSFLHFNTLRPPLDDPRVRKAINLAIDRELITEAVLGAGEPIASYPPKGLLGFHDGLPQNPYDVEQARALIAEALPQGHTGTLELISKPGAYPKAAEVMQVVASQLAEIGLNVEPRMVESAAFNDVREAGNYDLSYYASVAVTGDPARYFLERVIADRYGSGWKNEEVFELIRAASQEPDLDRAAEIYRRIQELMVEDTPFAYIYQEYWNVGVRDNVDGFQIAPHRVYDIYRAGFTN